jgi:hypothetical protein
MKTTSDGLAEGSTVRLTGSHSWPNLVTKVAGVKLDAWRNVVGVWVDVGRDDGPAIFRPSDVELVP